jgi:hypothetical protein
MTNNQVAAWAQVTKAMVRGQITVDFAKSLVQKIVVKQANKKPSTLPSPNTEEVQRGRQCLPPDDR